MNNMSKVADGTINVDSLPPQEMATACENAGAKKAGRDSVTLLVLGILAGAFIALGAMFMTITATGATDLPFGIAKLLNGLVFSLGLILVIVGGAELFTGDALMVVAWASKRITLRALLRAWGIVYAGNVVGAVGTAALVFLSGQYTQSGGAVGQTALAIANAKASIPTIQLFFLALLCNVLVCLAVWMSLSARSVTGKVAVIVLPVAAFVAAGFEHSIANLYFLPFALFVQAAASVEFWSSIGQAPSTYGALTIGATVHNIGIATIGNLVGGSLFVGAVYWLIYLRPR